MCVVHATSDLGQPFAAFAAAVAEDAAATLGAVATEEAAAAFPAAFGWLVGSFHELLSLKGRSS